MITSTPAPRKVHIGKCAGKFSSVLQCAAVCCGVMQCVAVCYRVFRCGVLQSVSGCCSVL